jgi:para-aminobenzoate synthetase/4-amino-4-deoxychorismate lyase
MHSPTAVFESHSPFSLGWSASFEKPLAVREAKTLSHVLPLLDFVEKQVTRGRWGVLLLSYEAAPALNLEVTTHPSGISPLAWAAVFDHPRSPAPRLLGEFRHSPWRPALGPTSYIRAVTRLQNLIARGDTYQGNFTFPLRARWSGDPWAWYRRLAASQKAPYSAYVDMGRLKILSLSPELFFEKRGNLITARPMKGSAPRGRWDEEDRAFCRALRASPKERAENVMIVDLLRNDLGKIARSGSIRTTNLFSAETYPTVWQMTSEINARLRREVGLVEMMEALFPSGSVTGAPKRRTMEIIRDLEPRPRGIYTGALGLLRPNGHWTFSVAIRTLTLDEKTGEARCPVGSGITADASPAAEYRECLLKGEFLKSPSFQLLESLRLEKGTYFLHRGHLERLRRSAIRLGFAWEPGRVRETLRQEARRQRQGCWKVRLLLTREGMVSAHAEPLSPGVTPWRVALAKAPVDDRDIFLYHKTTHREIYEHHRRGRPGFDDVILWNQRGEITESTLANVVVTLRGRRYTPPLSCGLLDGVFRRELLRRGQIHERVIYRTDLRQAESIFLLNSVRRWIPVIRGESQNTAS